MPNESLSANDLLLAEQSYLAQVAFQTNEDRSRVSTFYVASVGSLVLAITGAQTQLVQPGPIYWGFVVLFLALSLTGLLVLLQLVRLRQAWFETVLAMNQLKEYYTQHLPEAALETAFMWTNASLPNKFTPWSISFLLTLQVAIIGGVTFGGGGCLHRYRRRHFTLAASDPAGAPSTWCSSFCFIAACSGEI
ncbi:MAG: hypothetical protein R2911_38085 [Caldilineaceae bacterium]